MKIHIDLEVKRQFLHIYLGLILMFLIHKEIFKWYHLLGFIILGVALSLISRKKDIPVISWFLDNFERKENRKKFPGKGTIFFFAGVFLAVFMFPKDIALASIMILTLGDSVSHLIGKYFGKKKTRFSRTKFIEGTIAGVIMGFLGAVMFVSPLEAFLASFFAMLFELIEFKEFKVIDDNVVVPVVAGLVVVLMRLI